MGVLNRSAGEGSGRSVAALNKLIPGLPHRLLIALRKFDRIAQHPAVTRPGTGPRTGIGLASGPNGVNGGADQRPVKDIRRPFHK